MIGVMPAGVIPPPIGFRNSGDLIAIVGVTDAALGASEYARTVLGKLGGSPPPISLESEVTNSSVVRAAIERGILASVHDCSEGGLGIALAESCISGGIGAKVRPEGELPLYVWLFSESASRYIVSLPEGSEDALMQIATDLGASVSVIGRVGGSELTVGDDVEIHLESLERSYESSFAEAMGYGRVG